MFRRCSHLSRDSCAPSLERNGTELGSRAGMGLPDEVRYFSTISSKGVDPMGLVSSMAAACLALAVGIATSSNANAQTDGDLSGIWLTQDQGSTVRISRCSRGYCGSIVNATKGAVDANNPDLRLRTRPLEGLMILQAPTTTADGFEGQLYNPRDGKSYSGRLVVTGKNSL